MTFVRQNNRNCDVRPARRASITRRDYDAYPGIRLDGSKGDRSDTKAALKTAPPSPFLAELRQFLTRLTSRDLRRRRLKVTNFNNLHPTRWRCFYLASIPKPLKVLP